MTTGPSVIITEEIMRDGLQVESVNISVEQKLELLDAIASTGLPRIMVGSFVSPKWTPQMADIDQIVQRMKPRPGVTYLAVALNDKGRERLHRFVPPLSIENRPPRIDDHLCEVFVRRNYNRTQEQVRKGWQATVDKAVADGATSAAVGLHEVWGSNWRGHFDAATRLAAIDRLIGVWAEAGVSVSEISLFDPMGWNMPNWVHDDVREIRRRYPTITRFRLHLHNQRGTAMTSIYAALSLLGPEDELYLESSIGGLGGCPYCGNGRAAGMVPTEDMVQMLQSMGYCKDIDLYRLCDVAALASSIIGRPLSGHVSSAGPLPHGVHLYPEDLPLVETHEHALHWRLGPATCEGLPRPWITA